MVNPIVAAAVFVFSASIAAQQSHVTPEAAAARKRLEYFVGQWKIEGSGREGPGGKPQPFSGSQRCEWFDIGSQVMCRGETTDSSLTRKELVILGYNPVLHVFTRYNVDGASGANGYSTGKVDGKDWHWTLVYPPSTDVQMRTVWSEISPDVHSITLDATEDGKAFTTVAEGRMTRIR